MAETRIEFDVPARMRDGTVLRADVCRPGGSGPWPVRLNRHFGFGVTSDFMGMPGRVHDVRSDRFRRTIGDGDPLEPDTGKVLLFVMGVSQWREETEWPLSRAVDTDFHLRANGRPTPEQPSTG